MVLVGHNDLDGNGDGGEGLALQQFPDGRKVLYLAHEAPARCLSVIDVTRPEAPVLVNQLPSPSPGVTRCNSLGLSGTVLAVANQAAKAGGTLAGMWVLDVSSFDRVRTARSLDDLKLSFFDTSGPHSRGVHNLWFVDGEFAHLTTGMPDFTPTNEQDDQIWVTVDLRDPRRPREVGRWWLPGHAPGRSLPAGLPAEAARTVRRWLPAAPDRDLARPRRPRLRGVHRRRRDDLRHRRARAGAQRARPALHAAPRSGRRSSIRRSRRGRTRSSRCFPGSWRGLPTRT